MPKPTPAGLVAPVVAVLAMAFGALPAGAVPTGSTAPAVGVSPSGRYLVGFNDGTAEATARRAAQAAGAQPVEWIATIAVLVIRPGSAPPGSGLTPAPLEPEARAALLARPDVVYLEVDPIVAGSDTPNDPEYAAGQWAPQKIRAPLAWDTTTGSAGVVVAVLDTGLDMAHPEFAGKFAAGSDFVNNDSDPSDDHGHGTHVAGIVGAATNNAIGVASIGRRTTIRPGKVLNNANQGTHSQVAAGITWATDQGAKVINLSLAGTATSTTLKKAVAYAVDRGVLVVAAAGNTNTSAPNYPAAYPGVMAIAATTSTDERWGLSNFGTWISMAAPGSSIRSTDWAAGVGAYSTRNGTSQAAPHVAGVAALMLAARPGLTATELRSALESSALDSGTAGRDDYFGAGRLDAAAAVALVVAGAVSTPTPTAAPPIATVTTAPVISAVTTSNVGRTTAKVKWTTDVPSTSQVEYGATIAFGSLSALDQTLVTAHTVSLSGLARNTAYTYRVRSKNAAGAESTSASFTFRTAK